MRKFFLNFLINRGTILGVCCQIIDLSCFRLHITKNEYPKLFPWVVNTPSFVDKVEKVYRNMKLSKNSNPWLRLLALNKSFFTVQKQALKAPKRPKAETPEDKIGLAFTLWRQIHQKNFKKGGKNVFFCKI